MIRVAVDAMGGDRGPEEIVAGAVAAASDAVAPIIVGSAQLDSGGLELIEAPDVIAMDEKPTEAVRAKPNSSLVAACRAVGSGKADAVVSAGNTGAMLAACLLELRRIPNVRRPAIAVTIPATMRGQLGGLLIRPAARRLRNRLDPDTYGGAYLLGLRGLAVIAHGNSSRRAIANAVRLAARGVEHDIIGRLAQKLGATVLESATSTTPTPT